MQYSGRVTGKTVVVCCVFQLQLGNFNLGKSLEGAAEAATENQCETIMDLENVVRCRPQADGGGLEEVFPISLAWPCLLNHLTAHHFTLHTSHLIFFFFTKCYLLFPAPNICTPRGQGSVSISVSNVSIAIDACGSQEFIHTAPYLGRELRYSAVQKA